MSKSMSYKQVYLIFVIIMVSVFTLIIKTSCVSMAKSHMKFVANYLVWEQEAAEKKTTRDDNEIIAAKILPKSTFRYVINPFVWTTKQMSANDDLLQACLDAKEREDIKDALKYKEAAATFEARFSMWELNFEKAKESLKDE